jgi:hypothetical protein
MNKTSIYHQKDFLTNDELQCLITSVRANYAQSNLKNAIHLKGVDHILKKIERCFEEKLLREVEHVQSLIFLSSTTTMAPRMLSASQGWHIDGFSTYIEGECFNVWLPIYNDSTDTGLEIISEEHNKELFAKIGDQTEEPLVYTKETAPRMFKILTGKIPPDSDLLIVKVASGLTLPIKKGNAQILRYENPSAGDVVIFKQTDIHRGFLSNGIRIQLSLKFRVKDSRLNTRHTNTFYKLFESIYGSKKSIGEYRDFMEMFIPKPEVTKHGSLERETILSLLKSELLRLEHVTERVL